MSCLRFRCPGCAKLYEVEVALIKSFSPQFDCVSCGSRFSFDFPPPQPGKIETRLVVKDGAQALKKKACPRCAALNFSHSAECYSCGVIFSRYEQLRDSKGFAAHPALHDKWQTLLADFANEELHNDFLISCQKAGQLKAAILRYRELVSVLGDDPIASKMLERAQALMDVSLELKPVVSRTQEEAPPPSKTKSIWQWLWLPPSMLSLILLSVGLSSAANRNLIGVAVALGVLGLGIYYSSRQKPI